MSTMKSNYKNRAKSSGAKDIMGLGLVFIGIILLVYLVIENYMGYTGLQSILNQKQDIKVQKKVIQNN